ncbi:unnamed protein product [Polarella glacialis]|uniref:Uncharacterized protein n=1 Tax=Polarella glacialis TaxID=89957 RepID=A0A813LAB4_POLGL|nr:unnamed protein product [Polarella glacialis]CAE8724685.1 unnamed protein product [Polarella glacialis]
MHLGLGAPFTFLGDGRYPGDGGPALQRLWVWLRWREIKNCPGRYTTSERGVRTEDPEALLACGGTLLARPVGPDLHHPRPVNISLPGKDPIQIFRLPGGGGLLTYCKPDGTFVHTLNTESGLARKVDALGISVDELLRSEVSAGMAAEAAATAATAAALRACVEVLPYLVDSEKNASAYALILKFRRAAAGVPSET